MLAAMYSLGTVACLLLALVGVGRPLVRWLQLSSGASADVVWSVGLGLSATMWGFGMIAAGRLLTPEVLTVITLGAALWGACELACVYLYAWTARSLAIDLRTGIGAVTPAPPPSFAERFGMSALVLLVLCSTLIGALAPTLSHTAQARSLETAKTVLLSHGWSSGTLDFFPSGAAVMYAAALALDGPVAASLLGWCFGLLLAGSTIVLARPLLGRAWSAWSGGVLALVPGLAYQLAVPLDDLLVAALVTLALAAWWRGTVDSLGGRWLVACGMLFGAALAVKGIALLYLAAVGITWWVEAARRGERREEFGLSLLRMLTGTGLVAAPFLVPAWLAGARWFSSEPSGGVWAEFGPLALALLPGLWISRRLRGLSLLATIGLLYALFCIPLSGQTRWLAPLAPLVSVGMVWAWVELKRFPVRPRQLAQAAVVAIGLMCVVSASAPWFDRWAVACGWQSREAFLVARAEVYRSAMVANQVVHPHSRLLSQDDRGLYFNCRVFQEQQVLPVVQREDETTAPIVDLPALRKAGITHVLLRESLGHQKRNPLAALFDPQAPAHDDQGVLSLTDYVASDPRGETVRYRLLMLR